MQATFSGVSFLAWNKQSGFQSGGDRRVVRKRSTRHDSIAGEIFVQSAMSKKSESPEQFVNHQSFDGYGDFKKYLFS